jgi:hypothetical protein
MISHLLDFSAMESSPITTSKNSHASTASELWLISLGMMANARGEDGGGVEAAAVLLRRRCCCGGGNSGVRVN